MRLALITVLMFCFTAVLFISNSESSRPGPLKLGTMYFDSGSFEPLPQDHDEIGRIANAIVSFINYYGDALIVLEGHTDSRGGNTQNLNIGESRAAVVRGLLAERGVPYSKMRLVTHGANKPVGDNKTKEGRAKNRRVEVYLIK